MTMSSTRWSNSAVSVAAARSWKAIEEIRRVTKHGVVLGSITTDLAIDLLERHDLLEDVQTLGSRWDWAERFHAAGFVHALTEPSRLDEAWKIAAAAGRARTLV